MPYESTGSDLVPFGDLPLDTDEMQRRHHELTGVLLGYQYAIDQMVTRLGVLREDFNHSHGDNPIESISSRLKSPASIIAKLHRKNFPMTIEGIRENILDIAGIRVTCSFIADIYTVRDLLLGLPDVTLIEERDYIAVPKPNGYKSLHLIVAVPVVRAAGTELVTVEVQIRTIAMDFWASLEHKIYYKYDGAVPEHLVDNLRQAAVAANHLDEQMQELHQEVQALRDHPPRVVA
ncbi:MULTISPECIES: GTP pyrophosphokinase family protein [unclassified Pseudactinotalea]|uniref:GTP pyrophosphokinase n=1 Tax=unclassified Pseudactinotalea TaxID=2649176 RepID=UPI00128C8BCE|nr:MULTISPECIES: GTP pyrophosphokinase family protein [unclassified Pseudactinotalea]MPV50235.1 GTP pyrophosphokinase family protein [Pseudactinotalea sp. HY160]QGH70173.1 GTP pyrophosphokinase family protein [Pseudactinotalea sp. HY158]